MINILKSISHKDTLFGRDKFFTATVRLFDLFNNSDEYAHYCHDNKKEPSAIGVHITEVAVLKTIKKAGKRCALVKPISVFTSAIEADAIVSLFDKESRKLTHPNAKASTVICDNKQTNHISENYWTIYFHSDLHITELNDLLVSVIQDYIKIHSVKLASFEDFCSLLNERNKQC